MKSTRTCWEVIGGLAAFVAIGLPLHVASLWLSRNGWTSVAWLVAFNHGMAAFAGWSLFMRERSQ